MTRDGLNVIQKQVMWTRLIAVVEEQAQALLRTAFGSVVREAGDLSAGVYDITGRMLAQAVTGTPGHVNTMAMAVQWMGTGHLFDFVIVTPAFIGAQPVALFASTSHVTDVGGLGFTADARSVFEEGVLIPHMPIRRAHELNQDLLNIIASNSRNPIEVIGDIRSLISCNDVGVSRLQSMLQEFKLNSLDSLAKFIFDSSERATREAIARVPDGMYLSSMTIDGYENPIELNTSLAITGDQIVVDYAGSSPASQYGINSPKCYTDAYTVFGLKCVIAPDTPNNHASLRCFEVRADSNSCVAPERPAPVTARHVIGQMLPDAVFGCLAQVLPSKTPAESAGSIWVLAMSSVDQAANDESSELLSDVPSKQFNVMNVGLGGVGATQDTPGLSTTAFPSGVGGIPIEVTETESPLLFRRKEFIQDSGGPGQMPGGLSQRIEIANTEAADFLISAATWDRLDNPPRGRSGGCSGRAGEAYLASGPSLVGKTTHRIPTGDAVVVELPGGGGFGDPAQRAAADVMADLEAGYISAETARKVYRLKE